MQTTRSQSTRAIILADKIAYSPRAACHLFEPKIGEGQIYQAIKLGELKAFRIGSRSFILKERLLAWVAAREGAEICH